MNREAERKRLIETLSWIRYKAFPTDEKAWEFIADRLLDDGVIVPPCKVGDKVYYVNMKCDENCDEHLDILVGEVVSFSIQKEGLWMYCRYEDGLTYWHKVDDEFGTELFTSREDAEKALTEKGGVE